MKRISIIFFWNIFIFITTVIFIELFLGYWFSPTPRKGGVTCFDSVLHHKYCANVHELRHMAKEDGNQYISTYISKDGISVNNPSEMNDSFNINNYELIIIGDSFIQAEEIKYADRLGAQIQVESGQNVLSFGYSSWAPALQTNWLLSQKLKRGDKIIYFIMGNDFTPKYASNNLNYHKSAVGVMQINGNDILKFKPSRQDEHEFASKLSLQEKVVNKSFFISRYQSLPKSTKKIKNKKNDRLIHTSFTKPFSSC
jgi:hypothetical protein